jgi:PEGA domain
MSATVAPGCDHATGALAPKSSSQPNASALPPLFQLIGNLVDSGLHALLIDAIVESVCAIGGFFPILHKTPRVDDRGISMRMAFAWVLCGVVLSACSAIPGPSGSNRGTISLESNPPGAEARLSSSGASCRTPCTLPVKVSDYNVTFALAGYTPRFIPIRVSIKREHWYSPEVTYVDPNPVMALLQPTPPPPGSKNR